MDIDELLVEYNKRLSNFNGGDMFEFVYSKDSRHLVELINSFDTNNDTEFVGDPFLQIKKCGVIDVSYGFEAPWELFNVTADFAKELKELF